MFTVHGFIFKMTLTKRDYGLLRMWLMFIRQGLLHKPGFQNPLNVARERFRKCILYRFLLMHEQGGNKIPRRENGNKKNSKDLIFSMNFKIPILKKP